MLGLYGIVKNVQFSPSLHEVPSVTPPPRPKKKKARGSKHIKPTQPTGETAPVNFKTNDEGGFPRTKGHLLQASRNHLNIFEGRSNAHQELFFFGLVSRIFDGERSQVVGVFWLRKISSGYDMIFTSFLEDLRV